MFNSASNKVRRLKFVSKLQLDGFKNNNYPSAFDFKSK